MRDPTGHWAHFLGNVQGQASRKAYHCEAKRVEAFFNSKITTNEDDHHRNQGQGVSGHPEASGDKIILLCSRCAALNVDEGRTGSIEHLGAIELRHEDVEEVQLRLRGERRPDLSDGRSTKKKKIGARGRQNVLQSLELGLKRLFATSPSSGLQRCFEGGFECMKYSSEKLGGELGVRERKTGGTTREDANGGGQSICHPWRTSIALVRFLWRGTDSFSPNFHQVVHTAMVSGR